MTGNRDIMRSRVHSVGGVRFGRKFHGLPSIELDGWVRELQTRGNALYARTDTGWWRIRRAPGFYVAYRSKHPF